MYQFYPETSLLPIVGAPSDANWRHWSMLHDGSDYRMYCFKGSTSDTLYQFTWDGSSFKYVPHSVGRLTIAGLPDDADTSSFSMVYGQESYQLYFRQLGNPTKLYQFIWNESTTDYNYFGECQISLFPNDTDWSRWSMLYDGNDYRIYAFKLGSNNILYQGAWNGNNYEYGYNSNPVLTLENTPSNSNLTSIAMLHVGNESGGSQYNLYMQSLSESNMSPNPETQTATIDWEDLSKSNMPPTPETQSVWEDNFDGIDQPV